MEKYEQITVVGEGSYGLVMKCRHKESDQVVAIKKFLETEEDATVRKMALREIRMLKRLVFEFLEGTVLDELEKMPGGLGEEQSRERIFQVTRAINYCHSNHIIHRDVKPENVLVSSLGVVKLCDFGFARLVSISGEPCTEYVATRWYRAPELLVGEVNYGAAVDIWAIGCLFAEMMTGDPLFPGDSDIDQLYLIVKMLGKPCGRHQQLMSKSSQLRGMVKSASSDCDLYKTFQNNWSLYALEFLASCMKMDPHDRSTSEELLKNAYFLHDRFPQKFLPVLREKVNGEFNSNPLLRKFKTEILMSTDKKEQEVIKHHHQRYKMAAAANEQVRWKFTLATESGMKRKFSYDIFSGGENNNNPSKDNLISLSKTSQRLKQQPPKKLDNKPQAKNTNSSVISGGAEMQMLEKSLESLAKFNNNEETVLEELVDSELQSLNFSENNKSLVNNNNVLHPSINNISFNRTPPPKKSPSLLHSLSMVKPNQVPLLGNPRAQFLKKLERNVVVDTMFCGSEAAATTTTSSSSTNWLNGYASNIHNKKKHQHHEIKRNDVFTLPNLPGVGTSPHKSKKKQQHQHGENVEQLLQSNISVVTPRIQSSTSQKYSPTTKNSSSFPF